VLQKVFQVIRLCQNELRFALISGEDIHAILDAPVLIERMRTGFLDFEAKTVVNPERTVILQGEDWWGVMPSLSHDGLSVKVVSVIPENSKKGMDTTQGIVLLFDRISGQPKAMFNGTVLTAVRTSVVSALFASCFGGSKRVFIIGAGLEARYHALLFSRLFQLDSFNAVSRSEASLERFREWSIAQGLHLDHTLRIEDADTVIAATTSSLPVVQDYSGANRLVISIGAHTPGAREVSDKVLMSADRIVVDTLEGCIKESGDIVSGLRRGLFVDSKLIALGQVLSHGIGTKGRFLFKSVGSAFQDLYACLALLDLALSRGAFRQAEV
jgi:alanine dehydrogenase